MHEIAGWLSAACFTFSAVPQVIRVYRTGDTAALSWGTLGLWLGGEVFGLGYIYGLSDFPYPLFANYVFNGVLVGWLVWRKCDEFG